MNLFCLVGKFPFKGSERTFKGSERTFKGSERTFKGFEQNFYWLKRTIIQYKSKISPALRYEAIASLGCKTDNTSIAFVIVSSLYGCAVTCLCDFAYHSLSYCSIYFFEYIDSCVQRILSSALVALSAFADAHAPIFLLRRK